jgi:UDPglucose--hexose-1-phosphate uridylyltransferase
MPDSIKPFQYPHRRWNPLRRSWVMVSPHRTQRPWQGEVSKTAPAASLTYDSDCYLCPGNKRANGDVNPPYDGVFSFTNDYAAVLPTPPEHPDPVTSPMLLSEPVEGICKVICFHPDHSLTLAKMSQPEIRRVVDAWVAETQEIAKTPWIKNIQIFENRGAMMGASNPHPHCQIWATSHIPDEPAAETAAQQAHLAEHGSCLLCDYLAAEQASAISRIVVENAHFLAVVPWWAVWPFETLILSKTHRRSITEFTLEEREAFADILKRVTTRYDSLFDVSFPYTMGFHQAPVNDGVHPEWHFHAHFYPPLLRSATVRKFMVGFEMLGMPQRDITPEDAAARLRAIAD